MTKKNLMIVLMLVLMVAAATAVMAFSGDTTLFIEGFGPGANAHCVGSSCTL